MFRRITFFLEDYFGISPKEARGAFVLLVISFVALWIPTITRRWIFPLLSDNELVITKVPLDSVADQLTEQYPQKENYPPNNSYQFKEKAKRPIRLSRFDPNTASPEQLEELGMAPFMAKRIVNYRNKGGQFRKKEDLLHIYDFPSELYKQLESYIVFPKKAEAAKSTEDKDRPTYPAFQKNSNFQKIVTFDINTADTTQLIRLKGIGSKLSMRILKYRDALGGFHSKAQFSEIFGLDSLALSQLTSYAEIKSPVKKLAINTATVEELSRHPYFRNRRMTQTIVSYRQEHGPYRSEEDLKKTLVLDQAKINSLLPYLEF
jgi:competence protein ComEA